MGSEESKSLELVQAQRFQEHLRRHSDTFSCPCCQASQWAVEILSIDPDLVDNRDGGNPDLDVALPRAIPGVNVGGIDYTPPMMQALPAVCQSCGYIALFDAKVVARVCNDD